jgi:hypothetical protein
LPAIQLPSIDIGLFLGILRQKKSKPAILYNIC